MVISNPHKEKLLKKQSPLNARASSNYCHDCVLEWCKNRGQVSYCSFKYRGTRSYSCEDGTCKVKRIAGA